MSQNEDFESWKHGIKLEFLISWSQQQGITPSTTTREVCENFVKPATQTTQLSYCEQLLLSKDTADFVGCPSAFISHAWDFHFLELLEALTSYFAAEEHVIIWLDVFCNNQHISAYFEFDWWCSTFKKAIHSFGRTVMVLAPWNDPLPLQRGWCIWELYCTIEGKKSNGSCTFDVAMSSASIEHFVADVNAGPRNVMNKMLAKIDTSKSECFKEQDRETIHDVIRRTIGFDELDKEISQVMRAWVISKYERRHRTLKENNDPKTLNSMYNLACLYDIQKDYEKARPLYEECLERRKTVLGASHPETLSSMNNLACLYNNQKDYEKARPLYEECLRMSKVVLGEKHSFTFTSMNNLAGCYFYQGEYGKAVPLYEHCFRLQKIELGEKHPNTLMFMNNLACLYKHRRMYGRALPLYKECLRIMKVVLGERHPDTLVAMTDLAVMYKDQGKYAEALPLYEECLRIKKTILVENDPSILKSMTDLAVLYKDQGEYVKALPLYEECFRLLESLLGENHPVTLSCAEGLANVQMSQGEYGKALLLYEKCLRIKTATTNATSWITAMSSPYSNPPTTSNPALSTASNLFAGSVNSTNTSSPSILPETNPPFGNIPFFSATSSTTASTFLATNKVIAPENSANSCCFDALVISTFPCKLVAKENLLETLPIGSCDSMNSTASNNSGGSSGGGGTFSLGATDKNTRGRRN